MQRLLASSRCVRELLLGPAALGEQRLEPLLRPAAARGGGGAPRLEFREPVFEAGEIELRDARPQPRDLDGELLRTLGCRRLQRQRPEPLLDLGLDVARAFDLDRDPRQLQLGAMTAGLEAAEPGGLLDQRPSLGRLGREDRLDLALADDRVHPLAEAEVGEQLDEVEAPHGGPVDEVLALAAAVQPPRHRELCVVDGQRPVGVVEEELDLAEVGSAARAAACEEDVVRLLGPQLGRAQGAGGPADRIRDVGLAGAVRADDHTDARLETDLDRVGERLKTTQLDGAQMHRPHPKDGAGRYCCSCSPSSRASGASSSAEESSAKISRIPRGVGIGLLRCEPPQTQLGIRRSPLGHWAAHDARNRCCFRENRL